MRKRRAVKRDVLADPIYNSKLVTKLINQIMQDGKKGTAQKILYNAFDMIKEKTNQDPMEVFEKETLEKQIHRAAQKVTNKMLFELRGRSSDAAFRECIDGLEEIYACQVSNAFDFNEKGE